MIRQAVQIAGIFQAIFFLFDCIEKAIHRLPTALINIYLQVLPS